MSTCSSRARASLTAALLLAGCAGTRATSDADDGRRGGAPAGGGSEDAACAAPQVPLADAGAAALREPFEVWRRREPVYELYVRHFSPEGTFAAVERRLPELLALGIGIVWLLPVHEIGGTIAVNGGQAIDAPHGNPYAVRSYERLNPEYGSPADLKRLVARAHELGMHVIVDWVPNHTAFDSELVVQHPDWYARDDGALRPVSQEFAWIAQLDWSKRALRDYMTETMRRFVADFDVDGFRIDFAHAMPLDWFAELRAALEQVKPVFLLAEAGDVRFHPTFDMTYDWNVYPLLGDVAHGVKPATAIDDALLHTQLVPYAALPNALVMRMTYNHDDNGKFTLGERYRGGIKTFAVLSSTLPGKPLVFDGQEVGMNVFDGTRVRSSINLGHDPAVKIDWSDPEQYRPFYTKLLRLFRANPSLHQPGMGDFRKVHTNRDARAYAFLRRSGADAVLVVLNLSPDALPDLTLTPQANAGSITGDWVELFSGATTRLDDGQSLPLGPWAYRVYVRGPVE